MKVNSEISKGIRNPVGKNNNPDSAFGSKKPKQGMILDSNQADYTTDTSINLSPSKNTEGVNQIGSQTKNKTKQFQIDSIDLDEYNNENISSNILTYSDSGQVTSASSSSVMNPTGNKQIPVI